MILTGIIIFVASSILSLIWATIIYVLAQGRLERPSGGKLIALIHLAFCPPILFLCCVLLSTSGQPPVTMTAAKRGVQILLICLFLAQAAALVWIMPADEPKGLVGAVRVWLVTLCAIVDIAASFILVTSDLCAVDEGARPS